MSTFSKYCPSCESKNIAQIVYGEPTFETSMKARTGKIHIGGCMWPMDGPEYFCNDCRFEWNKEEAMNAAYRKISVIKAEVGGHFGGCYSVTIDLIRFEIVWDHMEGDAQETYRKSIRRKTADDIVEALNHINLLKWKSKYVEEGICDGTQWSVEIKMDGRQIEKSGSNKFPTEWVLFCQLIRRLTRRQFR